MTAVPESDILSDAELAVAAAAGDRGAFAGIYDRYADRLHDFCIGMVRDANAAADCVQDTFCTAATRLDSLREPDKLRPWLYAIARNEALRFLRARRREQPSDELPDETSSEPGPEALAARSELAELVAQAAGGLSERDRTVLELTYRHGLDGPELAEALGVSAASARTLTHRLRETVERSLGALLVVRNARAGHGCAELASSLQDWDGQFTVLTRKRVARHIDSCVTCEAARAKLVNREALLGASAVFIPAPDGLRKRTLDNIQLCSASSALGAGAAVSGGGRGQATPDQGHGDQQSDAAGGNAGAAVDPERRRRRGLLVLFFLLAAALFAALWLAKSWRFSSDAPSSPAGVTATSSQPSPSPTATSSAPSSAPSTTPPPAVQTSEPAAAPPPVVRTTAAPTYIPQKPQQYIPPPPAQTPPAASAPPPPPVPIIEPTFVAPVVSIPVIARPVPNGPPPAMGSTGGGSSGGGTSSNGTSGPGSRTPPGGTTNPTGGGGANGSPGTGPPR
jgi:RNA polymerase sigma factor (sigma-70 family)